MCPSVSAWLFRIPIQPNNVVRPHTHTQRRGTTIPPEPTASRQTEQWTVPSSATPSFAGWFCGMRKEERHSTHRHTFPFTQMATTASCCGSRTVIIPFFQLANFSKPAISLTTQRSTHDTVPSSKRRQFSSPADANDV